MQTSDKSNSVAANGIRQICWLKHKTNAKEAVMEPDQIIKYVNEHYRTHWSVKCGLDRARFETVVARWLQAGMSDTQFSRLRGSGKTPRALLEVLAHREALEAIADALNCPSLFSCCTKAEIDAMMVPLVSADLASDAGHSSDSLIVPKAIVGKVVLSEKERQMIESLRDFLLKPPGYVWYVAHWPDPPQPGGTLLAYAVAAELRHAGILDTYLAQPFSNACANYLNGSDAGAGEVPYENAIRSLAAALSLPQNPTPQALLDRLVETNSTLFVLHAQCLEPAPRHRASTMHRLILEAKERVSRRATKSYPLVLVGTPRDEKLPTRLRRFNDKHGRHLLLNSDPAEDASHFFEAQWRHYCQMRGYRLDAEAGSSRLKRARHYFIPDEEGDLWPATIRMQAFFASNFRTFTYFDPTAGWTKMTGTQVSDLPIDIVLHLDEVVLRLRSVDQDKKRWPPMRGIRWCSTALYWLTSGAATMLAKGNDPQTDFSTFHSAMIAQEGLVEVTTERDGSHSYKIDLAARAAVQDRWMRNDPKGRAESHRMIAERLLASMDNKELLGIEFPIEPHWGRSRMHFLAEAIRHLVRTCDHATRPSAPASFPKEGAETLPKRTSDEWNGCDPYEVINYCFGVLYWRELNGNGRGKQHSSRKLALRHGAYHLTGELLQLMSENQEIGKPHWALNEAYVGRYLREVAFSQLDLGDLSGAKQTFKTLIAKARTQLHDPLEVIDYQLDLTVVLASMGDLSEAESALAEARDQFSTVAPPGTDDSARLTQHIQTRIRARQANLAYLRGNFAEALEHCTFIEERMPAALVRDVAHTYISTLGAMGGDRRNLEKAINICTRQLFDNTSRGLHHEALGFRVALGHAFRKLDLLQAAEAVLDGVYEDVLQYGCAERTYLSMLLEAGRVLEAQGRYARAYAAYFRPCYERAYARGYARTAAHAKTHALQSIRRLVEEVPEGGWSAEEVRRQLEGRGEYLHTKRSKKVDPRFSFDPVSMGRWVPRLQTETVLKREIESFGE